MEQLGNLLDRPRLYNNIDGLAELGASVMCLSFAIFWGLLLRLHDTSIWHRILIFAFVGLLLVLRYATRVAKTRITYPRTGFVEYRREWRSSSIAAALGVLATAGLGVGLYRQWDLSMLGPLAGFAFAFAYGYHFATAVRWKWVVACAIAVASAAIAFLPADILAAVGREWPAHPDRAEFLGSILLSFIVCGSLLLISGAISLCLYLRHTQPPPQEGQ